MLQSLIDVILPVFLVVAAGYAATQRGYFTPTQIDGLMKFTQGFAIPCLLFRAIANLDLSNSFDPGLLISFYTGAGICFCIGMTGARLLFKRDWEDAVVIGFCCLFSNSVLLGLPITERAFGPENLTGNYAIIAFHSPFCYGLGITVMEVVKNRGAGSLKTVSSVLTAMFKNVLILGISLGFAFNLAGLTIPGTVDAALQLLIQAALPTALFALGGVLVPPRRRSAHHRVCLRHRTDGASQHRLDHGRQPWGKARSVPLWSAERRHGAGFQRLYLCQFVWPCQTGGSLFGADCHRRFGHHCLVLVADAQLTLVPEQAVHYQRGSSSSRAKRRGISPA
jgi:malonate transporter